MTYSLSFCLVLLVLVGSLGVSIQNASAQISGHRARSWTSKEGVTIEGVISDIEDEHVVLKERSGKAYRVSPSDLIEEDQEFIDAWRKRLAELEESFQAPGRRKKPEERQLRLCRIAMDISSNCFETTFGGSMKKVDDAVERIINELNRAWVPEVGIQFEIGNLEVRTEKESDPYQATREPGAHLGIGRRLNEKHRCDIVFILCANASHGGGLGGGRSVWAAWGGDAWDLMHHEFSHAFGTAHGHGWPFELGTMNQASQGSRYPRERRHTFNYKEIEIIREHSKDLEEIGFAEDKVSPFAMFDEFHVKKAKQRSRLGGDEGMDLFFDPLANDYDLNGEEVTLRGLDRKSVRGAKLTKLQDGRIRYQLKGGFSNYLDYDFFHYTIVDEGGLESRGAVALIFDQAEEILKNGDFSDGKRGWRMENADVVDNGEAITSIKFDKRALLHPGGEIVQEVDLDGSLSEKYVLEVTTYCGPERDSGGQSLNPAEDPELVVGLYGEGRKVERKLDERDQSIEMPFGLRRSQGTFELRFTNEGSVPVRVGHVVLRPTD